MSRSPNILWICTEHQRHDTLSGLGFTEFRTPHLDRLMARGTACTHAYCQSAVCMPSRISFLTGRYPSTTGCRQNGQDIPANETLVTARLARAGYQCGLFGKLHVRCACHGYEARGDDGYQRFAWSHGTTAEHGGEWVQWLENQGRTFQEVVLDPVLPQTRRVTEDRLHQTSWCFDQAADFIAGCDRDRPWLASINPFAAHDPFDFLQEMLDQYDLDHIASPQYQPGELEHKPKRQKERFQLGGGFSMARFSDLTDRELRQMRAAYMACIEHIDRALGRLLNMLEESGQLKDTLVVFHADHGELLGDHGLFAKGPMFYDSVVRVPLIFSWPGHVREGHRIESPVELVTVAPTLCHAAGMEVPREMEGEDLWPVLTGVQPEPQRKVAISELAISAVGEAPGPNNELVMWREDQFKLILDGEDELGELYDLEADPGEFHNLWTDPAYQEIRERLIYNCRSDLKKRPGPARVKEAAY